ncbi:MAG: MjaI family restriction endonuclease, partial [Candidatus Latescibacteria bacterium]|nr:MjaI family restriction endonuclease [Candidatus Latescibacterota bacterium]
MAKEWILNSVMNRFQLNFKRNVGATSESIRKCTPKTKEEWREYYFKNIKSVEHIEELGKKLYTKISEVILAEIEEITEKDCIDYMFQLVIDRTFDGYMTEIKTIYGQLEKIFDQKIEPSPDEWDRLYNVDFHIKINNKYIGLKIKPVN